MQELEYHLSIGQGYRVSFRVSLSDSCNYAVSGIGALFTTDDSRYWDDEDFFDPTPQIENHQDSLLDDKVRWMEVSGQFVASGGEKFITIGCFNRDIDENIQQVSAHPPAVYNWDFNSYYIDAVELHEDNSIGISEPENFIVSVYPNPAKENLTIQSKTPLTQVWLTDLTGRRLAAFSNQNQKWKIDVSGYTSGIYLVEAISEDGRRGVSKVAVQ